MLNGVDPTPLEVVDFVKSRVGKFARRRE